MSGMKNTEPEKPHFIAYGDAVMLDPGGFHYSLAGECHHTDRCGKSAVQEYGQILGSRDRTWSRSKLHLHKGRVSFVKDWKVRDTATIDYDDDGNEVNYNEWPRKPIVRSESVELPEDEWKTSWRNEFPHDLLKRFYGPLKILV